MAVDRADERLNAEWLRAQAKRFSTLAEQAIVPDVRSALLEIAREYEHLAAKAEASRTVGAAKGER